MKKIKATKRLNIRRETLRELQLAEVTGGIAVPTKPQASCFVQCIPTGSGLPTECTCQLLSANC